MVKISGAVYVNPLKAGRCVGGGRRITSQPVGRNKRMTLVSTRNVEF